MFAVFSGCICLWHLVVKSLAPHTSTSAQLQQLNVRVIVLESDL